MTDTENELPGRVALVTGAGRNIGRAIALELAAGGAAVAVNVRSNKSEADAVVQEIEAMGGKAAAFIADIADQAAVEKLVAGVVARFGGIDYLINNAALRREKPIDEMTLAEWREVMSVTLDGVFLCVKACLPHLKRSGAGAIVNIGGLSAYTGSKHRAQSSPPRPASPVSPARLRMTWRRITSPRISSRPGSSAHHALAPSRSITSRMRRSLASAAPRMKLRPPFAFSAVPVRATSPASRSM